MSDAEKAVIESALQWHAAEGGSEEEKDAAINLAWACGHLKWESGEIKLPPFERGILAEGWAG